MGPKGVEPLPQPCEGRILAARPWALTDSPVNGEKLFTKNFYQKRAMNGTEMTKQED